MPSQLGARFVGLGGRPASAVPPAEWIAMFASLKRGTPAALVARKHGVSRATLERRYKADDSSTVRFGPKPALGVRGENELVQLLLLHESIGMCVSMPQLRELVRRISAKLGNAHFVGGRAWEAGFFRRHPQLARRSPELTERKRVYAINPLSIKQYFERLGVLVKGLPPARLWAFDEMGFDLMNVHQNKVCRRDAAAAADDARRARTHPSPIFSCSACILTQVVATKGSRSVVVGYNGDRQRVSLGVFFNAAGDWLPPVVMLKGSSTPRGTLAKLDHFRCWPEAPFVVLPKATQTEESWGQCAEYWATAGVVRPKSLLIVDGHSSRVSKEAILALRDRGHSLFTLPPHTSHKLQAFDVGVAAPLRKAISVAVDGMRLGSPTSPGVEVTNKNIVTAIKIAMTKVFAAKVDPVTGANVGIGPAAFRKIGVYPFNPKVITDDDFAGAHYFNESLKAVGKAKEAPPTSAMKLEAAHSVLTGLVAEAGSLVEKLRTIVARKKCNAVPGSTLLTGDDHIARILAYDEEEQVKIAGTTARLKARAAKRAAAAKVTAASEGDEPGDGSSSESEGEKQDSPDEEEPPAAPRGRAPAKPGRAAKAAARKAKRQRKASRAAKTHN